MEMGVSNECGDGDHLSAICYQKGCFEKKSFHCVLCYKNICGGATRKQRPFQFVSGLQLLLHLFMLWKFFYLFEAWNHVNTKFLSGLQKVF